MKNVEKSKNPIVNLYGVMDIKAGRFFPPFTSENDQTAARAFAQMSRSEGSIIAQNPEDFRLFLLGDFDPNDGQIDTPNSPVFIADASEYFRTQPQIVD